MKLSWVQVSHNGLDYVITTYFDNVRVSEIVCQADEPMWIELKQRIALLKGLAQGKIYCPIGS